MRVKIFGLLAEDRPGVGFEAVDEDSFAAAEIAVEHREEAWGMIHLGKMCYFVEHNIVAQFLRKEHQRAAQCNNSTRRAGAQCAVAGGKRPSLRTAPHGLCKLTHTGHKHLGGYLPGYRAERIADAGR